MFSATITAVTAHAATVVIRRLTSGPMIERFDVKTTSGTSANGIPNESTTCESTSVRDGLTPIAITTNAGIIVTSRRTSHRDLAPDEALHHDLPGERPDGGAREARGDEREREERAGRAAEDRLERLVRAVERVDVEEARAEERRRSHHEHRDVDQAGDRHRDDHVDARVAEERLRVLVRLGHEPVLGQRRVEVDDVRHDRRAEDPDREEERLAAAELRHDRVVEDRAVLRVGEDELGDVAGADHADERRDHRLERPRAEPLQTEDRERRDARDDRREEEAPAEEEAEADRRAEELGEVGRHRDQLGLAPEQERRAPRVLLAADLREVAPGRDPELGRERLDQHRREVRGDDHPHQPVAEARAGGDVGREVAGVDVGDAGDERRPQERQDPEARPVEGLVDRPEPGGERFRRPRVQHGESLAGPKNPARRGSAEQPQVGQVPEPLAELEPVADEELVRDREADVPDRQVVDEAPVRAARTASRCGATPAAGSRAT